MVEPNANVSGSTSVRFWLVMATGRRFRLQRPVVLLAPLAACPSALDIWLRGRGAAADVERCIRQGANLRPLSGPDPLRCRVEAWRHTRRSAERDGRKWMVTG